MERNRVASPELFFCLAGPVGVDLDEVQRQLAESLLSYGYRALQIHLTDILPVLDRQFPSSFGSLQERYDAYIRGANALRSVFGNDFMARAGLFLIGSKRADQTNSAISPAHSVAYIIRQLKRPEEIEFFRRLYGKQVFQISVYADTVARKERLAVKMRDFDPASTRSETFEGDAINLIRRDEHEDAIPNGQRIRDVFPLGDVFLDATFTQGLRETIERFVKIAFSFNFHSPSREEYGMYLAKSASLRSLDLSRQVGAAILTGDGEVKALGCNEVPSPNGGTFWEGDGGDSREFQGQIDTNEEFRHRIFSDVLKTLAEVKVLGPNIPTSSRILIDRIEKESGKNIERSLLLMDLIEYGRMLHAEMNAITDAARNGISLKGTTLYCTTFPCHLCAKHIIASGVSRVVYIEPYPKSYTIELYRGEIYLGRSKEPIPGKIRFEPFIGISPFRYRDFFEKSKRKKGGRAEQWVEGAPKPIVVIESESYIEEEIAYLRQLVSDFASKNVLLSNKFIARFSDHAPGNEGPAIEGESKSGARPPVVG